MLAAVILADRHDARGNVRDAHGRFGFLHVLAAGTRSAENVHAKVGRIDRDFDRIVNFRINVHRGKGRVPARIGVKGALAHQTVNARFGAKRAIGPFALNVNRAALDAGNVALGFFREFRGETGAFGIAQVHPLEHARPILRFGTAGTGLDFDVAVGAVLRLIEHALEFELFNVVTEGFDFLGYQFGAVEIFIGNGHVEKFLGIRDARVQALEAPDEIFKNFLFFTDFLCALRIVPERRVFNLAVDFL